jgi:hypothetical protein
VEEQTVIDSPVPGGGTEEVLVCEQMEVWWAGMHP